ncbi:hypothetical protein SAMN05216349_11925 [Oribacterium sp. KHPX15]|uniref:hypothetical protein n=1 Tax=Oribacterium sp. KHPX15 TaxID=1855342 RepID=UPI00089BCC49|nr:hypothetical protein [Oribacterium sp. KHPX15]SEA61785.1 hypothetical protein SAMN05216349_11925 [Oribacterium sp. KHPX15]
MKKLLFTTFVISVLTAFMASAGVWKKDSIGWWYDYGNGTYPASCWQWIDSDSDYIAECYYFNDKGYLVTSSVTPDGSLVDRNGAWISVVNTSVPNDGYVQTKVVAPNGLYGNLQTGTYYFASGTEYVALLGQPSYKERIIYGFDLIRISYYGGGLFYELFMDGHKVTCGNLIQESYGKYGMYSTFVEDSYYPDGPCPVEINAISDGKIIIHTCNDPDGVCDGYYVMVKR